MSYESKAITKKITATSRIAIKIRDNYFTVEFSEERDIPEDPGINMEEERKLLFETVNSVIDEQAYEIEKTFKN